jgi:GH15 family glucan-1,4-alpha-glucosidase
MTANRAVQRHPDPGSVRYAPIRDYAILGDGRTTALIARDASIDWLCLPNIDSPSVFAALLDADHGGRFELAPDIPFDSHRRYLPSTNVLETTFGTDRGSVRVTDALSLPLSGLSPMRELTRRVDGISGRVPLRWRIEPGFGYATRPTRAGLRSGVPVLTAGADALALCAWEAGAPQIEGGSIYGSFEAHEGTHALLVLAAAHQEPLVLPSRSEVERRFELTIDFWARWSDRLTYDGPWRDAVVRSALALKVLCFAPSGAIAAAPTTSLPETIGGERNWDYRFCWIRDAAFTLNALLRLGCHAEVHAFFWWFLHATQLTRPRAQVLYRLDGGNRAPEVALPFEGYRGSAPVRVGNAAAQQLQLDIYGDLFETAYRYVTSGYALDKETVKRLSRSADLVCQIWREPDLSIWEVRMEPKHFIHSKAMCWVALDRAIRLAAATHLPARDMDRWRHEADDIRHFIEHQGWSDRVGSYVRYAGSEEVDASLLLLPIMGYCDPRSPRSLGTIDAVSRILGTGPFVYRYLGEDGLARGEGVFLTCSFWLVQALALAGRRDEAVRLMEQLLVLANDVGLYSEEIDPRSREFLGNFPQALVHLALIGAAQALADGARS